jgi:sulfur-oxidizing protein SoxY
MVNSRQNTTWRLRRIALEIWMKTYTDCWRAVGLATVALVVATAPASASQSWQSIRDELYAGKTILDGSKEITLIAPDRPDDQLAVPVSVEASFKNGHTIKSLTILVDENPAPIAATFRYAQPRAKIGVASKFRFDAVTGVRAIVETDDGQLYMTERMVRFTGGQSACSAPPNGSDEEIRAKMGNTQLAAVGQRPSASNAPQRVKVDISHPNHTGMVKDQISLLYIPLRLMDKVAVQQSGKTVVEIEGSMSVAQDPSFEFDYLTDGSDELTITASDTSGERWTHTLPVGPSS